MNECTIVPDMCFGLATERQTACGNAQCWALVSRDLPSGIPFLPHHLPILNLSGSLNRNWQYCLRDWPLERNALERAA